MRYLHYSLRLLLIIVLCSCNRDRNKLTNLEQENNKLQEKISILKKQLDSYKFMPIVYPKSSTVKANEKYEAIFYIGSYSNELHPIVTVNNIQTPEIIDTLEYDSNVRGCVFNFSSKIKGHYSYHANMTIPTVNDSISFPIRWDIEIE
jgi:hypothetical protein